MYLEIKELTKIYQTGNIPYKALDQISFSVAESERCVILGPSGSGKSTLLNILGGIDKADGGEVIMNGVNITTLPDHEFTEYRRNSVGFVFQFFNLVPNLTVYENIEVAAHISRSPLKIETILDSVGIGELKDRFPRELSGGQQQRVSIARALVKKPQLLFCDEPTGALDYDTSKEILKLLEYVNREFKTTVFMITHNNAIAGIADHIIRLRSGKIAEDHQNPNMIPAERIAW